jgi:bifunctional DNA-binding transcriptional regulator/antitoxin component of YhaV-PrlF toxin-antitoxin module
MKFRAPLLANGKTATGIEVPAKIVEGLGAGKKPPVSVTIKGFTYRTTIGVMGGKFLIPVSGERREAAGIKAGDQLDVTIELDEQPRELAVPKDFDKALNGDKKARQAFDALSYSRRQWFVLSVEGARTEETRLRRIEKALETLRSPPAKK